MRPSFRRRVIGSQEAGHQIYHSFFTAGRLDTAVADARKSSTFLGALGAAQPVVSAALSFGNDVYDSVDVRIEIAADDIDHRIETEWAPLKTQVAELTDLELRAVREYTLLARYRLGDAATLDTLRSLDPATRPTRASSTPCARNRRRPRGSAGSRSSSGRARTATSPGASRCPRRST